MNIKDEIKKLEEIASGERKTHSFRGDFPLGIKQGTKDALVVINKLMEVVEMQQAFIERTKVYGQDIANATIVGKADKALEKSKQLLEGE